MWAARGAAAALGMRCWKPGSRLDGAGFSGDGFLAMPSDHLRGVEGRTEGSGPCRFLMSRDATQRNAITMTPACMGRSGIHFTREHTGSKKALQGSGPRFFWQAKEATFPWCRNVGAHSAMTTIATCHVRMVNGCAAASGEETNRFLRSNRPVW